jgi:hypothetical protein
MNMEDVRRHMVRQLEKRDRNKQNIAWVNFVKSAQTIGDSIAGDSEPEKLGGLFGGRSIF